jgi:phasin family protein
MAIKPKPAEAPPADEVAAAASTQVTAFTTTVESIKQSASAATASLEQASEKVKAHLNEGVTRAVKTAEQFAQFQQGNIEAAMKSGQILATGLQDLSKHWVATSQANFEEAIATFRQLSTVKSVREAIDLQTSFAKTSVEKALAEGGKLTETSLKLAEQVAAPLTARVNAAVETFSARA